MNVLIDDRLEKMYIENALKVGLCVNRIYEKPVITKCKEMTFPIDIIEASGETVICRQCSGCHGCR